MKEKAVFTRKNSFPGLLPQHILYIRKSFEILIQWFILDICIDAELKTSCWLFVRSSALHQLPGESAGLRRGGKHKEKLLL